MRVANQTENGVPVIKAGMLARVTLPTGEKQNSLLVPKDAIVLGGRTPAVYVVTGATSEEQTGGIKLVPVKLGIAVGSFYAVEVDRLANLEATLSKNDLVVIRGNERLQGVQKVIVAKIDDSLPAELKDQKPESADDR